MNIAGNIMLMIGVLVLFVASAGLLVLSSDQIVSQFDIELIPLFAAVLPKHLSGVVVVIEICLADAVLA